MLHVQFDVFCIFYTSILFALMLSCQGQSAVIGPLQPIVATVGDDIILPRYLYPSVDASDMTVEWTRPDLESRLVHVWPERAELQNPAYKGRTSLFTDELKHGNISLKISKVKLSDEGTYRCFIPDLQRDSAVRLVVGAASSPVAKINTTGSRLVLQCESAGWYPEPELLWLDSEGNLLSAGPTETLRGPDDLYAVSSRVTVEKRHNNNFTCRVQQKNISQSRETHTHVPDDFFMVISPSGPPTDPTIDPIIDSNAITGLAIGAVVVLVLILAVSCVVWKQRWFKCRNKKKSEEDGPEQTRKEKMTDSKNDNHEFHVVVEEGESEPLMAGREEEEDVESRGEQRHEEERKTKQDQFVLETEQTKDNPQDKRINPSVVVHKESLITIEKETQEDVTGREEEEDVVSRGEKTLKEERETQQDETETEQRRDADEPGTNTSMTETESQIKMKQDTHEEKDVTGRQERNDVESRGEQSNKDERETKDHQEELKEGLRRSEEERKQSVKKEKIQKAKKHQNIKKIKKLVNKQNNDHLEVDDAAHSQFAAITQQHETMKWTKEQQMPSEQKETQGYLREHDEDQMEVEEHSGLQFPPFTEEIREQPVLLAGAKSFNLTSHLNTDQEPWREKETEQPEKQKRSQSEGGGQRETMKINEGVTSDGTNRKKREKLQLRHEGALQAEQQENVNQKEEPEEPVSVTERGVDCEEEPQKEELKDETPDVDQHKKQSRKHTQEIKLHEVCNLPAKKQKIEKESRAKKHKNVRKIKKFVKKQNDHSQFAAITQQHETMKWTKEQQMLSEQKETQGYLREHDEDQMEVEEHSGLQFPPFTEEHKEQPVFLAGAKSFNFTFHLNTDQKPWRDKETEQPEKQRRAQSEGGGQREMMEINEGVTSDGTNRKEREKLQLRHEGALQEEQQENVNQKEEPEEPVSVTERGVDCEEEPQKEELKDETPDVDQHNMQSRKHTQEIKRHEVCSLPAKKHQDVKKQKMKFHGLKNQGATCYLNSVLQVLFMTKDFREAVIRFSDDNPDPGNIDHQLKALFNDLNKETANTNEITKGLGIDRVYEQHDAAEYMEKILRRTRREASQIFCGQLANRITCSMNHTVLENDAPFWHLPIALVDSYSVMSGIAEFFKPSHFCGQNQIYCKKCGGKVNATMTAIINRHPDVLCLLLKRFEFNYEKMSYIKINSSVEVPYTLTIPESPTYELYAVVDHFGVLRSGHYTATIKIQDDKDSWYTFNDTRVTLLDNQQSQKDYTSQTAYLLFYRKKQDTGI